MVKEFSGFSLLPPSPAPFPKALGKGKFAQRYTQLVCFGLVLLALLIILTACEAQATPIVLINAPTSESESLATAIATNPPNLRYGIFANAASFVQDVAVIESRAAVEIFYESNRYAEYDIVAAYGSFEGWQASPITQKLHLSINASFAPLDNTAIRALIPQVVDSSALVASLGINGMQAGSNSPLASIEIRTSLANMGYPDGLELSLSSAPVLGLENLSAEFAADNIQIQVLDAGNQAHLILELSPTPIPDAIEIYSLPISYIAKEGINIEFSENGWPLPIR